MRFKGSSIVSLEDVHKIVHWLDTSHEASLWYFKDGYSYGEIEIDSQMALFVPPEKLFFIRTWEQMGQSKFMPVAKNSKYKLLIMGTTQDITHA